MNMVRCRHAAGATIKNQATGNRGIIIGPGCVSLSHGYGAPPPSAEGALLLHQALDLGYDYLDTARIYGSGRSATAIGETLKRQRRKLFLTSKCGIVVEGDRRRSDGRSEIIDAAINASLAALQADHVELYYLRRRDFTMPIEESVGALARGGASGQDRHFWVVGNVGLNTAACFYNLPGCYHGDRVFAVDARSRNRRARGLPRTRRGVCRFSPLARSVLAGGVVDPALPPMKGWLWRNSRSAGSGTGRLCRRQSRYGGDGASRTEYCSLRMAARCCNAGEDRRADQSR